MVQGLDGQPVHLSHTAGCTVSLRHSQANCLKRLGPRTLITPCELLLISKYATSLIQYNIKERQRKRETKNYGGSGSTPYIIKL